VSSLRKFHRGRILFPSIQGDRAPFSAPPEVVADAVQGDGVEPGGKFGVAAEAGEVEVDLHEDFLEDVLGFFHLPEDSASHVKKGRTVPFDDQAEGFPVAGERGDDQLGVGSA
jgi:predicted RecA/RadA family phage recombinase